MKEVEMNSIPCITLALMAFQHTVGILMAFARLWPSLFSQFACKSSAFGRLDKKIIYFVTGPPFFPWGDPLVMMPLSWPNSCTSALTASSLLYYLHACIHWSCFSVPWTLFGPYLMKFGSQSIQVTKAISKVHSSMNTVSIVCWPIVHLEGIQSRMMKL